MKQKRFDGWRQVVLVALATGFGFNLICNAFSITNAAMYSQGQVVMSASVYGLAYSIYALTQGPPMLLTAKLVTKWGPKKVLVTGFCCLIVATFGLSNFITSGVSFVIIYGLLIGLINTMTSQLAPQTLVNNWFHQQRGRAQSIKLAICCVITAASPRLITYLVYTAGGGSFKIGWYIAGAGAVLGLLFSFFLKDSPEQCGQQPDGAASDGASDGKTAVSTVYKRPVGQDISYKEAKRTPIFWIMIVVSSIGFMCMMADSFSQVYYLSKDVSPEMISVILAVAPVVNIIFALAMAGILDRIEPAFVLGGILALYGLSCFWSARGVGLGFVFANSILVLLVSSVVMSVMPIIYGNYFGNTAFALIQGLSLMVGGLLSSTTGVIGGAIKDATGSYAGAYILYGVLAFIAAALAIVCIGIPCMKKYKNEIKHQS